MSKFRDASFFDASLRSGYKLLPFRFAPLKREKYSGQYLLTNLVGEYALCDRVTLEELVRHKLSHTNPFYSVLKSKHFIVDDDSSIAFDLLALKQRSKLSHLSRFTSLHLFVVTLRCDHSCPYCQVSRQTDDRIAFDMSIETAEKALAFTFRSPSPNIKIEFQGGEPLLNFEIIKHIVARAGQMNLRYGKSIDFVIATNLSRLDDEILDFCKQHGILLSTSLDGPEDLHNQNRPRPGRNSHQKAIEGIARARALLGHDRVGALMTTTIASLKRSREIIDEYVRLEFSGIFLRPLSPYGFAIRTKSYSAYSRDTWLEFYKEGLEYVLALNKAGTPFVEQYSSILLTKILSPHNPGYVDLMSPSGAGIAAIVYNYDGDIYASDEARMLAEMGDTTFRLGTVSDAYEDVMLSPALLDPLEQSFSGSVPMCSDCAFEPYCGSDPIFHMATQSDFVGKKPLSDFCYRHMEMCRHLISLMENDAEAKAIFYRWAFH